MIVLGPLRIGILLHNAALRLPVSGRFAWMLLMSEAGTFIINRDTNKQRIRPRKKKFRSWLCGIASESDMLNRVNRERSEETLDHA